MLYEVITESVGLDLYYTGDTAVTLVKEVWEKKLLSTGVRVVLPPNTVGLLMERGSIVKTPLKLRAGVIDPGYTGEIFVNLINPYNEPYTISPGDKLPVQLVSIANVVTTYNEVSTDDFNVLTSLSNRKEGKIGSSN